MYDIKSIESGKKRENLPNSTNKFYDHFHRKQHTLPEKPLETTTNMSFCRRRIFQRQTCLLSILLAFALGLSLGVFVPLGGMSAFTAELLQQDASPVNRTASEVVAPQHPDANFPTIYGLNANEDGGGDQFAAVSFIKERELPAAEVFRNAFHLEQDKSAAEDALIVKKLDASDGSIKEFRVLRTSDGLFRRTGPERRLSKPSVVEQVLAANDRAPGGSIEFIPITPKTLKRDTNSQSERYIKSDIYWGDEVEQALPTGFQKSDAERWNAYVKSSGVVTRLEVGCGRMQNRLVVFADGKRACARYRQNTDQIQGELFSFYLGQLLNLTNLAPSTASVIDLDMDTWSNAAQDIQTAQWKSTRPVVLTQWLPDLEPAGIPQPFQPLERHLNKFDIWNMTQSANKTTTDGTNSTTTMLSRFVELAQWSDLIVFDYLIANLDRVVNNLYNYQWNSEIMAAPAHNLARQTDSQLLVFLDNESGLLHGYRLLKKYEAYHGLLLDNLCVFRRPTIAALQALRDYGVGQQLQEQFERSTSHQIRDVLPSLPDKSIKILIDRIDRVLGQVQKCRDLFADR